MFIYHLGDEQQVRWYVMIVLSPKFVTHLNLKFICGNRKIITLAFLSYGLSTILNLNFVTHNRVYVFYRILHLFGKAVLYETALNHGRDEF
jgi:hypothetical protein